MRGFPNLIDVIEARKRIQDYIVRTPLHHYESLSALIGAEIYVKHENHQQLGSFKVRGAINVIAQLSTLEKERGIVAASTGNFGQGIAYAARRLGVQSHIVVPADANPSKMDSMRRLGATVLSHGSHFDDARLWAESLAQSGGYRYVHSANEPGLISGVATYSLEIFEDFPEVDVIIVPIGGGSGACGACIVAKSLSSQVRVIGVQSANAPGAYWSWKNGDIVHCPMESIAEGLATGSGYAYTQEILREMLDDFILVSDTEIAKSVVLHLENTHNLAEHAGAASLAAALKIKDQLVGKNVVLILSGGNITLKQLRVALET